MTKSKLDPRRHAYRPDLAAEALRGIIKAERYAEGEPRQVAAPSLPLRREPRFDSTLDTEALLGETLTVYEEREGWAWVQLDRDSYVGYMPSDGLVPVITPLTHRVSVLRTYVFPEPDTKSPPLAMLSLNAGVAMAEEQGRFLQLQNGGFLYAQHARPVGEVASDFVAVAEAFLGTPYLWGGRTSVGLDCSGLVQLAAEATGHRLPRDADMQAIEAGRVVAWREGAALRRGDLVFWEGHVGIMTSPRTILHANAHHMAVQREPFAEAKERIKVAGFEVTSVRRLPRISASARSGQRTPKR
ncbi:MAG: NlpC/P60 family protein [Methyloceanibacter sp.]|uniref:C40 family peptidase n=1 Tax=Methyloceanibacter sp. TaxID=1965321 RepID=UPI003D6C9F4A